MDPRKQVNPIDVIEAAYDLDVDDRAWLVRLTHLVRPLLDDGLGVMAYPFDIHVPIETWSAGTVIDGVEESVLPLVAAMQQRTRRYAKRQLTWLRKLPGAHHLDLTDRTPDDAARDVLAMIP